MPRTMKSKYEGKIEGERMREITSERRRRCIATRRRLERERREAHLSEACPDTRDTRIEFDHRIRIHETRDLSWITLVLRLISSPLFLTRPCYGRADGFFSSLLYRFNVDVEKNTPKISFASEIRHSNALIISEKMFIIIKYERKELRSNSTCKTLLGYIERSYFLASREREKTLSFDIYTRERPRLLALYL